MLSENLVKLYNTMLQIETKGESTKTIALCLNYLENLISTTKETEAKIDKAIAKEEESK